MSTQTTAIAEKKERALKVVDLLSNLKPQMALALPRHITPERMMRVAQTAINRNPKLQECTAVSLSACLMDCSALGLEPDGRRAHLIPYGNTCTLIIDYKGLVDLAYRSRMVDYIDAFVVRENDTFKLTYGTDPKIIHEPALKEAGKMIGVYGIAVLKGVTKPKFCFMTLDEVEAIRKRSKASNSGPWVTDFEEMAKKTVIRRMCKTLPQSPELADAIAKDDENEVTALETIAPKIPSVPVSGSFFEIPQNTTTIEIVKKEDKAEDLDSISAKIRGICFEHSINEADALKWFRSHNYMKDDDELEELDKADPEIFAVIFNFPDKWVADVKRLTDKK